MVKVISIVPYKIFPAKVGGQKGIALFNEHLAKEIELICVTVKGNDPRYAEGYTLLNVLPDSSSRYINPSCFFILKRLITSHRATHLLLEHPYFGWLANLLKISTGIKLIVHSHNIEATRWRNLGKWWWKILWWYERRTHRIADHSFFIHDEDREYAIEHFGLASSRCTTITYGIGWNQVPLQVELQRSKEYLKTKYNISNGTCILLFNGAFNYLPNLEALDSIVYKINPLLEKTNLRYKIIICGRDIPDHVNNTRHNNIIIGGFVDDIDPYFKGADIFINPITKGGGIKTKLVEALGYNLNAVTTASGAIGIDPEWCNGKMFRCRDNDWQAFAQLVLDAASYKADTPAVYFDHFFWGSSVQKASTIIRNA